MAALWLLTITATSVCSGDFGHRDGCEVESTVKDSFLLQAAAVRSVVNNGAVSEDRDFINISMNTASNKKRTSPACCVRMPTGCEKSLSEYPGNPDPLDWFMDPWSPSPSVCESRKGSFNRHCHRQDATSRWSADGNCKIKSTSPACCVRMPSGCGRSLNQYQGNPDHDWFVDPWSPSPSVCERRNGNFNHFCHRNDAISRWSPHGCGAMSSVSKKKKDLGPSSVKKVAEHYSCADPEYQTFAAYWDAGDCGHFGDDHNSELCGGIHSGECPELWEGKGGDIIRFDDAVEAKYAGLSEKVSCLKARLKFILKSEAFKQDPITPYANDAGDDGITLKKCDEGCSYWWHAQYECIQKRSH